MSRDSPYISKLHPITFIRKNSKFLLIYPLKKPLPRHRFDHPIHPSYYFHQVFAGFINLDFSCCQCFMKLCLRNIEIFRRE